MPSFACPGSSFPWVMYLGGGRAMIQTLMCLCPSSPLVPACVAVLLFPPHPLCLSPISYAMVASLQSSSALQFWQSCLYLWLRIIIVCSSLATLPFHGPLCPVLSLNRDRTVTISLKLFDFSQIDDFSALHSLPSLHLYIWTLSPFFATSTLDREPTGVLSGLYVHLQSIFNWAFTSSAAPGLFSSAFNSDLCIATFPWNSHRYCWELKFSFSFFNSLYPKCLLSPGFFALWISL